MNVQNIEKKENNTASFQVVVDAATFDKAVDAVYRRNKSEVYMPGFRKGKAPRQVIEGFYGKEVFYEEAVEDLADEAFSTGFAETGLKMVGRPNIENIDVSEEKVLTYTFGVVLYPVVKLGEYRGIKAKKPEADFDEARVTEELEAVRKRNARLIDVERPAQNGDRVTIDFEGFVDEVAFDGGKADDYDLELGSGTFIPGFEDQVVGMSVGEQRDVNVTFPEEYTPELAGKAAVFKVTLKGVQEQELPELDDELAKDISDFDTMAEYTDHLREDLKKKFDEEQEGAYSAQLMEAAINTMEVEIPDVMVDDKLEEQLRTYASSMGMMPMDMTRDEILKALSIDYNTWSSVMRPQANFELHTELLLDAIAEAEHVEVSDEEFEQALKEYVNADVVRTDLARRKAAQIIRENAIDAEPDPAPAAEEVPAAE